MNAGAATCLDECFTCKFPEDIVCAAQHITALELYTIVVAVKFWAPKLYQRKFIVSCDSAQFWFFKSFLYAMLFMSTMVYSCGV